MIPPLRSGALVATVAACCATSLFCFMDCNPTLFFADQWLRRMGGRSNFQDRRIWIVGASSGIGEELAYQLADTRGRSPECQCHRIHLILSSRSEAKLERVAATCRAFNPECTVAIISLDVCREEELVRAVQQLAATAETEPIDMVVFNTGQGHLSPALETSAATAESVLKINALWPMILTPLLFSYNLFSPHRRPHLVVTSSIAAMVPVPLSAAYAGAKHALMGYFSSLSAERPDILLHTVLPGPVDTEFHQHAFTASVNSAHDRHSHSHNIGAAAAEHKEFYSGAKAIMGVDGTVARSKLKMSVRRCAQLIRSTMLLPYSTESWVACQPVLTGLYLHKWTPSWLMQSAVYRRIGPMRVALWRAGLDLYDPASWKRQLRRHNCTKSGKTLAIEKGTSCSTQPRVPWVPSGAILDNLHRYIKFRASYRWHNITNNLSSKSNKKSRYI